VAVVIFLRFRVRESAGASPGLVGDGAWEQVVAEQLVREQVVAEQVVAEQVVGAHGVRSRGCPRQRVDSPLR
jgi:hypothetical protein